MSKAADLTTLLQLSVGLNLAVDAYASRRKRVEERIAGELDTVREAMDDILRRSAGPDVPIDHGLEQRKVKELSNRELSRYLADVTIRFYRRARGYGVRDRFLEPLLTPLGLVSLVGLVLASLHPMAETPDWLVWACSLIGFAPAMAAFVAATRASGLHEHFHRREANDTFTDVVGTEHDRRIRSDPVKGEISRVANQVRNRHRALRDARSAGGASSSADRGVGRDGT